MSTYFLSEISRRFAKRGNFYAISIINLSLAIAVSFLLLAYVQNEYTYDRYNQRSDELYILQQNYLNPAEGGYRTIQTPPALMDHIQVNYPEIKESCLLLETWGDYIESEQAAQFYEPNGFYSDANVFDIFTYDFISGNASNALKQPESIVLSESIAERLFPNGNAMGSVVTVNKKHLLKVTGVYKDLPYNMHIRPTYLCTFQLYEQSGMSNYRTSLNNQAFKSYAIINKASDLGKLNDKVEHVYNDMQMESNFRPFFNKVVDLKSPGKKVLIYVAASVLLLLLSAFNYANSASVGFGGQVKEFGVRQIMGAGRFSLIQTLLKEVLLITPVLILISGFIIYSILPYFNALISSDIQLDFGLYWQLSAAMLLFALLTLVSGILLPAYRILSNSVNPVLKGQTSGFRKASVWQRSLLVMQFVICVCFLTFSLVMHKQMQHILNKDTGINANNVIFSSPHYNGKNKGWKGLLKENLLQNMEVKSVSFSMSIPFYGNSGEVVHHPNGMDQVSASRNWVDADYFPTFGIDVLAGRNFTNHTTSESDKCLITEKMATLLGLENPVGQWIKVGKSKRNVQIIGLVEDHEHYSIQNETPPMIFYYTEVNSRWNNKVAILMNDASGAAVAKLNKQTSALIPDLSFEYRSYPAVIKEERGTRRLSQTNHLFNAFTLISLFVTLLGLFNIVYINTQARTKEIGIRKTNGARNFEIMKLLCKDLLRWILLAFVIACPLAYYAMQNWLQLFEYQTSLSWWIFMLAGSITFIISLLTVSWQSWKAAVQNPIKSLRYE